jgi:hypothetical protein
MSLTITLETETNEILTTISDYGLLERYLPKVTDKDYYCLRYIDSLGITVFNRLQMDDFIEEMKIIQDKSENPQTTDIIDNIIKLANKSKSKPHLYLKFYGD